GHKVLNRYVPIFLGYPGTLVRVLHVGADINARPTGSCTKLVYNQLTHSHLRTIACTHKESAERLVGRETDDEIISNFGQSIVSTEPLVQRVAVLGRNAVSRYKTR